MARDPWFDGQGIDLLRDDFIEGHPRWQRYIADGQITAAEILEQENCIIGMLEKLEPTLSDTQHEALTKVWLEYERPRRTQAKREQIRDGRIAVMWRKGDIAKADVEVKLGKGGRLLPEIRRGGAGGGGGGTGGGGR